MKPYNRRNRHRRLLSLARRSWKKQDKRCKARTIDAVSTSLLLVSHRLNRSSESYENSRQGHVDAGKSTLMGRLLYELGKMDEKKRIANERASSKIGKSSFSWAWEFDGTNEERER